MSPRKHKSIENCALRKETTSTDGLPNTSSRVLSQRVRWCGREARPCWCVTEALMKYEYTTPLVGSSKPVIEGLRPRQGITPYGHNSSRVISSLLDPFDGAVVMLFSPTRGFSILFYSANLKFAGVSHTCHLREPGLPQYVACSTSISPSFSLRLQPDVAKIQLLAPLPSTFTRLALDFVYHKW
ncbi:uncharacterized protein [Panulirus ornatus]|uniref:uncharacterized protein n=1 Tax=Panulirus ornatus TaxID=150431 RepID=UPI003A8BCFC5